MNTPRVAPNFAGVLTVVFVVAVCVWTTLDTRPSLPRADELRYLRPALNLLQHGVISGKTYSATALPDASLINGGPLVVGELAMVMHLSPVFRGTAECAVNLEAERASCPVAMNALKLVHAVELLVFLVAVYFSIRILTQDPLTARLAVLFALACNHLFDFIHKALSESLSLTCLGLLMLTLAASLSPDRNNRVTPLFVAVALGLSLGATILIKPATQVLLLVLPCMMVWFRPMDVSNKAMLTRSGIMLAAAACVVLPWVARNGIVLGEYAISDPIYLTAALSHRVAFNAMTFTEWCAAWVGYFPDIGDKLVQMFWAPDVWKHLEWGKESYYQHGLRVIQPAVLEQANGGSGTSILMRDYVLAEPFKHLAVSVVLLWRGLFLGDHWGTIVLIALPFVLRDPLKRRPLLILLVPAFALAVVHALLSVSLIRYNLALIPAYSLSTA